MCLFLDALESETEKKRFEALQGMFVVITKSFYENNNSKPICLSVPSRN